MSEKVTLKQFSLGAWLTLLGTLLVTGTGVTAGLSYVFATKEELKTVELKQADTGDQKLNEWRLKTLETRMSNQETRTIRIDKHVESLLQRFRVELEPTPAYQPMPPRPTPDEDTSSP
jgi:hypothetical protein